MIYFESKDNIFILLVHLDYLSFEKEIQKIMIPNQKIEEDFKSAIKIEWNPCRLFIK